MPCLVLTERALEPRAYHTYRPPVNTRPRHKDLACPACAGEEAYAKPSLKKYKPMDDKKSSAAFSVTDLPRQRVPAD
jgi:hypothetical protein